MREDFATAKIVLYGSLANPRINADGAGSTDLQIETVLKNDPVLANRKTLNIARYVPVDPKSPPKFLVFCDIFNGQIDAYRGSPVKSPAITGYLRGVSSLPADRTKQLQYFFRFLDDPDSDIALDAYLEFAKTGDADVARAAKGFNAGKIRKLIADPNTPADRIGLFAYLLGASGSPTDAKFLTDLLNEPGERLRPAISGILAGLIQLDSKAGWTQTARDSGGHEATIPATLGRGRRPSLFPCVATRCHPRRRAAGLGGHLAAKRSGRSRDRRPAALAVVGPDGRSARPYSRGRRIRRRS